VAARAWLTDSSGQRAILLAMSKHARQRERQRPQLPVSSMPSSLPRAPEQMLLQQIADGVLDPHLQALAQAIDARLHLLHTVATQTALAQLCVGDEVQLNNTIRPHYLRGLRGKIIEIDSERATVCLHRPVGRFHSGEIRCPPLTLQKLSVAA
jgi:hypothetical protein